MYRKALLLLPALTYLVSAIPPEKAVVPTAPGQIGVNPADFIPSSAPTEFFTQDQTTTRWIGVNTVIVETITSTDGATVVTTTASAPVAMITATAAGDDGTQIGDISFIVSPDAEAQLGPIFDAATAACSAAKKKIRKRDFDSCLLDFFASKVDSAIFGDLAKAGSTALKAYIAAEGDTATLAVLGTGVVSIGSVYLYISFGKFKLSNYIPQIVKIPAAQIDPTKKVTPTSSIATSTTTSSSTTYSLPIFTGLTHMDGGAFDTGVSGAMATVLEARWGSIAGAAVAPVPSSTISTDCTCTQLVSPEGSNLNLDCPIAQDGAPPENCGLVTSTVVPSSVAIPTLTPVPNPPTNVVCNNARPANAPAPSFIPTGQTFNRVAASEAIPNFCKSFAYLPQDGANCATWQSFPFDGKTLLGDKGGQTGIGTIGRIYMATRWDTGECPINQWWTNGDPELTPAAVYLNSTSYYNDCVAGFTATLGSCDGTNTNTDGGRASYNCLEYMLFPSDSSNLQIDCKASGGLAAW